MKHLALILLSASLARATENIACALEVIDSTSGVAQGYAVDYNNLGGPAYTVNICFDSPTSNCGTATANLSTPNPNGSFAGVQFGYTIPSGAVGSVTPKDGTRHAVYVSATSKVSPFPKFPCVGGAGTQFPTYFTYSASTVQPLFPPAAVPTTRATPANTLVLANASDTYSVGSGPTTVCTVNGTPIKSDGVAGYYVQKRGFSCSNVAVITTTVTGDISQANYASQIAPTITALSSSLQFIAITWVKPSRVVPTVLGAGAGQSITWVVANNGLTSMDSYNFGGSVVLGDCVSSTCHQYFNTSTAAPFTAYGIRPTMMIAAMTCSTCNPASPDWTPSASAAISMIDAGFAMTDSNPTGNAYILNTTDYGRNLTARSFSPTLVGVTANAPTYTVSVPAVGSLNSTSNILLEVAGAANNQGQTGNTWVAGALAWALTSAAGQFPSTNQTPATDWLQQGAIGSYGTVSEPYGELPKFPDPALAMYRLSRGLTVIEALWGATREPQQGNFVGDPLAAPFALASGPSTSVMLKGVTYGGVVVR